MAWDFISVSTYAEVSSGNLTLNAPASAQQGDLLVACIAYRSNVAFSPNDGSWNLVATQQSSGDTDATQGIASGVMYYLIRGASNPGFQFNRTGGDVAQGTVLCYRGAKSTPYDTGNAATLGTIGEPALSEITTAEADELIIAMISHGDNSLCSAVDAATSPSVASGSTDTSTDPTSNTWIERFDRGSNAGADTGLCVADGLKPSAGATGAFSADAVTTTRSVFIVGAFKKGIVLPTVTTQAASSIEETTATGNGNITDTGGENCDKRGVVYGTTSKSDPGNVAPTSSGYDSYSEATGSFGTGAFTRDLTGLSRGQLYYLRAYAHNSAGYKYGSEISFTTKDWVQLYPSDYIAAGGTTDTTFRLTAPSGKSGSDFQAGKISDDTNPIPSLDLGSGKFTETEWSIKASSGSSNSDEIELRVTWVTTLNTYTQTPKITISTIQEKIVSMSGGGIGGGAATTAFQKTKSVTMAGGGLGGGASEPKYSRSISGAGGGIAGGAATITAEHSLSVAMSGGGIAGGIATIVFQFSKSVAMDGGALGGGSAPTVAQRFVTGTGGGIAGGAAVVVLQKSLSLAMSGGGIAGGEAVAAFQKALSLTMSGGGVAGGAATAAFQKVLSLTMSGGGIAGGSASSAFQKVLSATMAGGGVAGGTAPYEFSQGETQSYQMTMAGGGIAGGGAVTVFQKSLSLTMSGGGVVGGEAVTAFQKSLSLAMSGGGLAGGSAGVVAGKVLSGVGGGVAGGEATFITQRALIYQATGGGIAGGSAGLVVGKAFSGVGGGIAGGEAASAFQKTKSIVMSGGAVGGGAADVSQIHSLSVTGAGGGIAGGSAGLVASKNLSGVGGGVAGGTAGVNRGRLYVIQGGAVAGGAAAYEFQTLAETVFVVMQGGAIGGGSAGLSGAYMWPRAAAKQGRGAVFLQAGPDVDIQALRREIKRKAEREAEERMIMATVKMFLENEDRWAA